MLSALARGSVNRGSILTKYICTYVVGHAQECHAECCWAICASHSLTHSDMLDSDRRVDDSVLWRWRWRLGTTAQRGHHGLDATNTKQLASHTENLTRATRASPEPAYEARAHSLRTGARQRCACVFLVKSLIQMHSPYYRH